MLAEVTIEASKINFTKIAMNNISLFIMDKMFWNMSIKSPDIRDSL